MKRWVRRAGIAAGSVVGLLFAAAAVVYLVSERMLREAHGVPVIALTVPTDAASIDEGRRQAMLHGCMGGCHGKQLEGAVLLNDSLLGRVVAPNVTAAAHHYSGNELALILRYGMRPDGRSLLIMPSQTYGAMTDEDLGRLIAFLESRPAVDGPGPSVSLGPVGRIGLVTGKFRTAVQQVAASVEPPPAVDERAARGRYLARSICSACHGTSLGGERTPAFVAPTLQVVTAYTPDDFSRLMKTGIATGGRKVGMMTAVARKDLSQLTDPEIDALYAYLHAFRGTKAE